MRRLPKRVRRNITLAVLTLAGILSFYKAVEMATREPTIVGYTTVEASTYWEACEKVGDQGVDIRLCVNYAIKATGQPAGSFQGVAKVPIFDR